MDPSFDRESRRMGATTPPFSEALTPVLHKLEDLVIFSLLKTCVRAER